VEVCGLASATVLAIVLRSNTIGQGPMPRFSSHRASANTQWIDRIRAGAHRDEYLCGTLTTAHEGLRAALSLSSRQGSWRGTPVYRYGGVSGTGKLVHRGGGAEQARIDAKAIDNQRARQGSGGVGGTDGASASILDAPREP